MKVLELFAGAGGAALGLSAAGFHHLGCIERDADACATLRAAGLPAVEGDVRDKSLYSPQWKHCDLLWASFPCQCWSKAGKRLGPNDDRNGWPWTVDAIDEMRPTWFAAENVIGLIQHKSGCDDGCMGPELCGRAYFDRVILKQLRERFAWVGWQVLNASSFGVPQHRRRVIIIAGPHAVRWPESTHFDPKTLPQLDLFGGKKQQWKTLGDVADPARAPSKGGPLAGSEPWRLDIPSQAVSATGEWRGSGEGGSPHKMQRAADALFLATGRTRLTIEECAKLQDFPTGHPFQGTKTSRYNQIGNAVPPKLSEVVGLAIASAHKVRPLRGELRAPRAQLAAYDLEER